MWGLRLWILLLLLRHNSFSSPLPAPPLSQSQYFCAPPCPPSISAYFLSLIHSMCKLREAFQGCLHLWSSHSRAHRKYQILKQRCSSSGAHFETRHATRMHSVMFKMQSDGLPTLPTQILGDPLSTTLNSLVFEHTYILTTRNRITKSATRACQILCHGWHRVFSLYLLISLRGWRDEEKGSQIIWGLCS